MLAKIESTGWTCAYIIFGAVVGAAGVISGAFLHFAESLLTASILFWIFALVTVIIFPFSKALLSKRWVVIFIGLIVMLSAWLSFVVILEQKLGTWLLFWILTVNAMADVGGYLVGRRWGYNKMLPQVSPGKTWEGMLGGYLLAVFCGYGLVLMTPISEYNSYWLKWLFVITLLFVFSIFGDLFESSLKRTANIKDSGSLLPGHGGLLDRIDSVVASLPVFAGILFFRFM